MDASLTTLVINLPEAEERRQRIASHLTSIGIEPITVVEAIRGTSLDAGALAVAYSDTGARRILGRPMLAGEIGCALSHLRAYETFLAGRATGALILEDDAQLLSDAPTILGHHAVRTWLDVPTARVLLLSKLGGFLDRPAIAVGESARIVLVRNAWLAHAYLINRAAARLLGRDNSPVRDVADNWDRRSALRGLTICGLDPFIAGLHGSAADSQIGPVRNFGPKGSAALSSATSLASRAFRRFLEVCYYRPVHRTRSHDR